MNYNYKEINELKDKSKEKGKSLINNIKVSVKIRECY